MATSSPRAAMMLLVAMCFMTTVLVPLAASAPEATIKANYSQEELEATFKLASQTNPVGDLSDMPPVYGVEVYLVTYSPGLVNGTTPGDPDATLSGLMMLPRNEDASSTGKELNTVVFYHGTIADFITVPSNSFNNFSNESMLPTQGYGDYAVYGGLWAAGMGNAVLIPDGYGLGDSKAYPYPYSIAEGYAISTFNMVIAAKQLASDLKNQDISSKITVAGYSEGGYAALAVHQQSTNATWADAKVTVIKSLPSGGPYDLGYSQAKKSLENAANYSAPVYFAYLNYAYTAYAGVTGAFASDEIATEVTAWFTTGTNNISSINDLINTTFAGNATAMFNSSVLEAVRNGSIANPFVDALKNNSLASGGWQPVMDSKVHLCHGEADTEVYISNLEAVVAALPESAVSFKRLSADDCSSHASCAVPCLKETIKMMSASSHKTFLEKNGSYLAVGVIAVIIIIVAGVLIFRRYRSNRADYGLIA